MAGDKGKRVLIHLSSDDDGDCSNSPSFSSSYESDSIDDDEDDDVDCDDGDDSDEDDDDDEDEDDGDDEEEVDHHRKKVEDDDQTLSNLVLQFLQEKRDLQELCLKACKAYLRSHGLRVFGNKDVCVQRILEHWRIKDGKAAVLYPRSSFTINCTGDVCKGDIVLFTQKVYGSFDKVTRNGKHLGRRTVAGRVVKESYGAAKQQHTFTVEVLWSMGMKKLPPLSPLLVKGRNLYRMKTYRQSWKNEGERRKVLAEKHRRGKAARSKREKRKKPWSSKKGVKRQKVLHGARSSQTGHSNGSKQSHRAQGSTFKSSTSKGSTQQHPEELRVTRFTAKAELPKHFMRHQKAVDPTDSVANLWRYHASRHNLKSSGESPYRTIPSGSATAHFPGRIPYQGPKIIAEDSVPTLRTYYASGHNLEPSGRSPYRSLPFVLAAADIPGRFPYQGSKIIPVERYNDFSGSSSFHSSCTVQFPRMAQENPWHFIPSDTASGRRQNGLLSCATRGYIESGSNMCVIASCWRCCRREGIRCNVHR